VDSECRNVAKAVLMSVADMVWTGQPTANGDQDLLVEEETAEQERVDGQTGIDGDKLIIDAAQKMRAVALAAASAAGGRVVDGKPEPGMATVYVGVTACFFIDYKWAPAEIVIEDPDTRERWNQSTLLTAA